MKYTLKIIVFFALILSSCTSVKQKEIVIYYFNNEFETPISVDCESIYKYADLLKIETNDKIINNYFRNNLIDNGELFEVDVRYKIIIESDTLCVDRFGNFRGANKNGKIKNFDFLKNYLKKYQGKKVKITEPLEEYLDIEIINE